MRELNFFTAMSSRDSVRTICATTPTPSTCVWKLYTKTCPSFPESFLMKFSNLSMDFVSFEELVSVSKELRFLFADSMLEFDSHMLDLNFWYSRWLAFGIVLHDRVVAMYKKSNSLHSLPLFHVYSDRYPCFSERSQTVNSWKWWCIFLQFFVFAVYLKKCIKEERDHHHLFDGESTSPMNCVEFILYTLCILV